MPPRTPASAILRAGYAPPQPGATWTPQVAGEALIEAFRWVHRFGGQVGPKGYSRIGAISFRATLDDHLEEGWGLPEVAGDDDLEARPLVLPPPPEVVTRHLDALEWTGRYLSDHIGSARTVGLWAACKARRMSFERAVEGRMARSAAYRLRDRGLSLISVGLDRERVRVTL